MNTFRPHGAMTVVAPVRPEAAQDLSRVLDQMVPPDHDVEENAVFSFADTTTVHFARFVVHTRALQADGTHRQFSPVLVFTTNYDGPLDLHLADIESVGGEGIDRIFEHCVGYPSNPSTDRRIGFLKDHTVGFTAFHHGAVGMSVGRIREEARLRDAVVDFLDTETWTGQEEGKVRSRVIDFLRDSEFDWALTPPDKAPLGYRLLRGIDGAKAAAAVALTLVLVLLSVLLVHELLGVLPAIVQWPALRVIVALLLPVLLFGLMLWWHERRDPELSSTQYDARTRQLAGLEDKVVQNQISTAVDLKAGLFRRMTARVVFVALEFLARFKFDKGKLGSLSTIHFARWFYLDGGRTLAFYSNYDGSWESYLGDFVDKASVGLTAVWSNSVLYPRTQWLVGGGSRDEERFKVWARETQVPTQVWYSAYKTLTLSNILNNREIRLGLSGTPTPQQISRWLRRL